jgi:hypothetical protein
VIGTCFSASVGHFRDALLPFTQWHPGVAIGMIQECGEEVV